MSKIALTGTVVAQLFDAGGNVLQTVTGQNLVVDGGLNLILQRLVGAVAGGPASVIDPVAFMAVGIAAAVPVHGDTTIGSELSPRKPVTPAWVSTGSMQVTAQWAAAEAVGTVNAVGLWTAAAGGVLFSHFLLPTPLVKNAFTPLLVSYTIAAIAG